MGGGGEGEWGASRGRGGGVIGQDRVRVVAGRGTHSDEGDGPAVPALHWVRSHTRLTAGAWVPHTHVGCRPGENTGPEGCRFHTHM